MSLLQILSLSCLHWNHLENKTGKVNVYRN